jgi:hypothetical protein
VALVNDRLHGSPWTSGYGPLAELFSLRRVPQNFVLYIRWLAQAHTPIALLGLAAIVVPLRRVRPPQQTAGLSIVIALFTVAVWGIYCAWLVFDVWWYTRFMLSSWPFVMLALGSLTVAASTAAPTNVRPAIAAAVIALGVYQVHFAAERQVFGARDARRRFVAAARVVRNHTDRNSVIISQDHNGSIRYYGGRMTLDSEWVPRGAALDAAIAWLKAHGVHTYAAIEDWELERLRRRFGDARAALALERPPVAIHEHQGRMLLFDLTDPRPLEARPAVERNVDIGSRAAPPVPLSRVNFREE